MYRLPAVKTLILFLFISLITSLTEARAKVTFPQLFGDNMVLQRNDHVKIWGSSSGRSVVVTPSWNNKKYKVSTDNAGNWQVILPTPDAGGPYSIDFNDGDKLTLQNILIGEVWVCSGQSNMEMPVKGFPNQPTLHSAKILLEADNPQIRLIRYERSASRTPQTDNKSTSWQVSDAQSAGDFSAVAFHFAQILQRKLNVPVGVIMSTWGGTKIESWMSESSLKSFPEIKINRSSDTKNVGKNDPAVLFNAMINPLIGYGVKGILWYQGEANRINHQIYDKLMVSMVSDWRTRWGRDMSFYYVQIAPHQYRDRPLASALVREAQLKASAQIPNSAMVVTMDLGSETFIHPPDKFPISERLAFQALVNTYNIKGLPYASPEYQSMKVEKDVVTLSFRHAENGLSSFGKALSGFEIAGEDKVFYPAEAKIARAGEVTVQSSQVKNPVAVRYAFKDWVVGSLFNVEGFPASSFRTDNW